jgi:outer membrane lipopolysaccharide assembly protein LptE/RlpB
MKKIVGYLLIALVGLLSACEKQLDQNPISAQATTTFYTSAIEFTQRVKDISRQIVEFIRNKIR